MKKFYTFLMFAVCLMITANIEAKNIMIDISKFTEYSKDNQIQVHYWGGSKDSFVDATKLSGYTNTYIAVIPDDATNWQVVRGIGTTNTSETKYNWQKEGSGNNNQYFVEGWDNSGYWETWTIGNIDGGVVYFDNSKTQWTGTIQFVIGHNTFSRTYTMTQFSGTNLWYVDLGSTSYQKWIDATYYAVISTSGKVADGNWGMGSLASKAPTYRTDVYTVPYNNFNMNSGNDYLATPANANKTGAAITMTYKGDQFWQYAYLLAPTTSTASLAGVSKEVVEVCKQSIGDPFSLQPKIKADNSNYDYEQDHQWFKYTSSGWQALTGGNGALGWGFNIGTGNENKLHEYITSATHTYYFLAENDKSKARFIDLSVTLDCSTTSKITNFDVVTSTVNAHDSTYILDGIVAFEDNLTNRLLVIEVKNKKPNATENPRIEIENPTTPCVFSVPNCYANNAAGVVATAQFYDLTTKKPLVGDQYKATATFHSPNALTGIATETLSVLHGSTNTLVPPKADPANTFVWNDGDNTHRQKTIPTYNFDTTVTYVYYEYEPAPEVDGNLIDNGNFSTSGFDYGDIKRQSAIVGSKISGYNYWGTFDQTSNGRFYDDAGALTGGMAIVQNANKFWMRFTDKITPKSGTYFALFDGDSQSRQAWFTNSSFNTKLKLKKGTNYMFSFWVANINNYGEMNNAAILQFELRYKKSGVWSSFKLLGSPTDLNDYKDNMWHQNSFVYTAEEEADEVEIAVRDLNTSKNKGGNDFALDDIQFAAISVRSQAVKYCQRFIVHYEENPCTLSDLNITQSKVHCSEDKYTLTLQYKFNLDPKVSTSVTDKVTVTDRIGSTVNWTRTETPTGSNGGTVGTIIIPDQTADGKLHNYTIKYTKIDEKGNDKSCEISKDFQVQGVPAMTFSIEPYTLNGCNSATYNLPIKTIYAYQSSNKINIIYDDELASATTLNQTISYGAETNVVNTFNGLLADGKQHSVIVKPQDATYDCSPARQYFTAPFVPVLNNLQVKDSTLGCGEEKYAVRVSFEAQNVQAKKVTIVVNGISVDTAVVDGKNTYLFSSLSRSNPYTVSSKSVLVYFKDATQNIGKATPECKLEGTYTEPAVRQINSFTTDNDPNKVIACDQTTYTLTATVKYVNQDANPIMWIDSNEAAAVSYTASLNSNTENTGVYTMNNILADGEDHILHIKFNSAISTNACQEQIAFTAPFAPKIVSAAFVSCSKDKLNCSGTDTYDVTVTVNVENALSGKKIYASTTDGGSIKQVFVTTDGSSSYNLLLSGLTDANDGTRTVKIYFEGHENCANETVTYQTPLLAALQDFTTTATDRSCDNLTYSISGTINFDAADGTLIVEDIANPSVRTNAVISGSTATFTIAGLVADSAEHNLKAYFSNNPSCEAHSSYKAPSNEQLRQITVTKDESLCKDNQYDIHIQVTVDNPYYPIVITDKGTEFMRFPAPATPTTGIVLTKDTFLTISGSNHLFEAYISDMPSCKKQATAFIDPVVPKLTATTTAGLAQCDGTYTLTTVVKYINQNGTLKYQLDANAANTAAFNANNSAEQTLTLPSVNVPADGAAHTLYVQFDGSHGCDTIINLTPVYAPAVSIDNIVVSDAACDNPTYSIELTINQTNTTGAPALTVGGNPATYTLSSGKYIVSGLQSEGRKAVNVIASWAANGCQTSIVYDEPLIPHLDEATVSTTTLACGETTYDLAVSVPFQNTTGTMSITDNDVLLLNTDTVKASPFENTFTGILADGLTHNLVITFGECSVTATYTAPTQPTCNTMRDTICIDDWATYNNYGFTLTEKPAIGINTYTQGFDSLYLFVETMPELTLNVPSLERECENITYLRVPILGEAISVGSLVATIDNYQASADIDGTDVVITLPATVKAGDYTVTVYALNESGRCSSQETQFTLSLAYENLLYRKWDDVLFVSNKDSLFTAYQWYHNGSKMNGETQQRLYNPNGLSGLYYCEMTTKDGDKRYTCEEDFNDIKRSADVSKQQSAQILPNPVKANQPLTVIRTNSEATQLSVFTTTGELISSQTINSERADIIAPQTTGVYMVRIDGQTLKLIVK